MAAYDLLNQKSSFSSFGSSMANLDQNAFDDQISNNLSIQNYQNAQLSSQLSLPGSFGEVAFGAYELLGQGKELYGRISKVKEDILKAPEQAKAILEKGKNRLAERLQEGKDLAAKTKSDLESQVLETKDALTTQLKEGGEALKTGINETVSAAKEGLTTVVDTGKAAANQLKNTAEQVVQETKQGGEEFLNQTRDTATKFANDTKGALNQGKTNAQEFVNKTTTSLKSTAEDTVNTLKEKAAASPFPFKPYSKEELSKFTQSVEKQPVAPVAPEDDIFSPNFSLTLNKSAAQDAASSFFNRDKTKTSVSNDIPSTSEAQKVSFLKGGAGGDEEFISVAPKPAVPTAAAAPAKIELPQGPIETRDAVTRVDKEAQIVSDRNLAVQLSVKEKPTVSRTTFNQPSTRDVGRSQALTEVSEEFPIHEQISGLTSGSDLALYTETSINKIVRSSGTDNPFASITKTLPKFSAETDFTEAMGGALGKKVPVMLSTTKLPSVKAPEMPVIEMPKMPVLEMPKLPSVADVVPQMPSVDLPAVPKAPNLAPIADEVKAAGQNLLNTGQNAALKVENTLSDTLGKGQKIGSELLNTGSEALNKGINTGKNAIDAGTNLLKGGASDLADLGEEAASTFIPVVGEVAGIALGVTQLVEGFKDLFNHPSAAPPVTVPLPQIAHISQGFQSGI